MRSLTPAPMRAFTLSLSVLTALTLFGLSSRTPARADAGYITAKTWKDPANGHAAYGDNSHDDWQNLQDMINYALYHNEAVKFEPGQYRITKTLLLSIPANSQVIGFRMSGIAGANSSPGQTNGVGLVLDASATGQPAVLEVGFGAMINLVIEDIGLSSNVPNYGTPYGLLFGEQEYSVALVNDVAVSNCGICFANVVGTTGGGNGEALTLTNCSGGGHIGFYYNNDGQSVYHRIINCQGGTDNGGVFIQTGNNNGGHSLDVSNISCTFGNGSLRNTFLEIDGVSGTVNVKGGRVEHCDTILSYVGGGPGGGSGVVNVEGIIFDGCQGLWPLLDATHYNSYHPTPPDAQYTNTILKCRIGGTWNPLTLEPSENEDLSRNYFEKCVFSGWTTKITDASNQPALNAMQVRVRDCRSAPTSAAQGELMNDLQDYTPTPPARGGY